MSIHSRWTLPMNQRKIGSLLTLIRSVSAVSLKAKRFIITPNRMRVLILTTRKQYRRYQLSKMQSGEESSTQILSRLRSMRNFKEEDRIILLVAVKFRQIIALSSLLLLIDHLRRIRTQCYSKILTSNRRGLTHLIEKTMSHHISLKDSQDRILIPTSDLRRASANLNSSYKCH